MKRQANHNDEHLVTPLLLFLLNASLLIGFYLVYELLRQPPAVAAGRTGTYLALFTAANVTSLLVLKVRRRLLLWLAIALHVALYIAFF
ncbi:MAG: hypothetical protein AAGH19_04485 [Pseudomonadota bacterium]